MMSMSYEEYRLFRTGLKICPCCHEEIDKDLKECDCCGADLTPDDDYDAYDSYDSFYIHSASDWYDRNHW
ncbi:hypothetical protein NMY25_001239 [Wohlfahrtiimonas chitiniclastica]|nr:hypothetical protein [Wohlfahrtiimonas chitiniclastica]